MRDGQDNVTARLYGEGEYQTAGAKKYVYLTDQLGSVRDVVDAGTGSLVGALDYSPYGQVKRQSGSVSPRYQFGQLPWDNNAGLSVSTTRFYDAGFARWMSRDPIREAGGINLYGYVGASPTMGVDPDGLQVAAPLIPIGTAAAALLIYGEIQNSINQTVTPHSTPLVPPLVFPSKSLPRGFWPGDKGAIEWGRLNGVDENEAADIFHDIKDSDKGGGKQKKAKDNYGVNSKTGDVCNPVGEVVGNMGD